MQAIETKYHGPSNVKGSRISAVTASGVRRTYSYDHALDAEENRVKAATTLAKELGWLVRGQELATGSTRNGYAHVLYTP
jgi:hypothetical protein